MKIGDFTKRVGGASFPIPVEVRRGFEVVHRTASLRNLELFGGDILKEKVEFFTIRPELITIQIKVPK